MRIGEFDATETDAGVRVSAVLRWEDTERPNDLLYFTSPAIDPDRLVARPEAFVLAAYPLALLAGERRLRMDGELCPRIRGGLLLATEQWTQWHPRLRPLEIEAADGLSARPLPPRRHEAMLLSGGIDSMSLLRRNRLEFGADHPCSITTGFFVFGLNTFDFADGVADPERQAAMKGYGKRLGAFAEAEGVDLIPIETNVRHLFPSFEAWGTAGWALATVATGMAAAAGVSDLWIANSGAGLEVGAFAQLQLTPWVSPFGLDIRVGERVATRLEETLLVADWEGAGDVVRSCLWLEIPGEPRLNCGVCEKCVRTMLALVALRRETAMSSFPTETLTASRVEAITEPGGYVSPYYHPLPPLLRDVGRDDLAAAVERLIQVAEGDPPRPPGLLGRVLGRTD